MTTLKGVRKLGIAAICAGAILAAMPARADLKITMHTGMKTAAMQSMPPMMDSMMQSTIYMSSKKYLLKNAIMSVLVDRGSKKIIMINNMTKTYTKYPYDPAMAEAMMQSGPGGSMSAPGGNSVVVDTGKMSTFLGHKVRHYVRVIHVAMGNSQMVMKSDILAAQDLPASDMAAYPGSGAGKGQLHGIPLKTVTTTTGGPMGSFTMTQQATSISMAHIPASVFSIPNGYTLSQSPMGGMPGMAPSPQHKTPR